MEEKKAEQQHLMDLDADLVVNDSMSTFTKEIPPKKNYQAVITKVVAAGTHSESFPPKAPTMVKKVLCFAELNARRSDGKRFVFSRKWTFSMADTANMKKDLSGAGVDTAKDFKLRELEGLNIMVNVVHKPNGKGGVTVKYGTFSGLMDGVPLITPEMTEIPDWAKVYISESVEYRQKFAKEIASGGAHPYADAMKKDAERKAKYPQGNVATDAPADESDLPF